MKRFLLICILVVVCGCKSSGPLAVIKNRESNVRDRIAAVQNLQKEADSPKFWSKVSNDESRSDSQRRLAVLQLLARHFRSGITLSEFSRLLDNPTWFSDDEVGDLMNFAGSIPVDIEPGDVVLVVPVCAHHRTDSVPTVWIRIRGEIDIEKFVSAIRGNQKNQRIDEFPVLQVGSNEWHDDGYSIENAFGMNPATYSR